MKIPHWRKENDSYQAGKKQKKTTLEIAKFGKTTTPSLCEFKTLQDFFGV